MPDETRFRVVEGGEESATPYKAMAYSKTAAGLAAYLRRLADELEVTGVADREVSFYGYIRDDNGHGGSAIGHYNTSIRDRMGMAAWMQHCASEDATGAVG